jgi:hypothetical protein
LRAALVALDGVVDGRTGDAEPVAELGAAVLAGAVQGGQVRLLAGVELGLLAAHAALGLCDPHPLKGVRLWARSAARSEERWTPSGPGA